LWVIGGSKCCGRNHLQNSAQKHSAKVLCIHIPTNQPNNQQTKPTNKATNKTTYYVYLFIYYYQVNVVFAGGAVPQMPLGGFVMASYET